LNLKRFLTLFTVFTVLLAAIAVSVDTAFLPGALVPKFWVIFGFIAFVTLIAYVVSSIGIKKGAENSIYILMGGITLKLLLCMAFVLVYLLKFRVKSLYFATEFFSLYFFYTAFEVYCLLRNLRHQNKT